MDNFKGEEKRRVQYVQDRPTERGVIITNVLVAVLGVIMTGIWTSVTKMEATIVEVAKLQSGMIVLMSTQGGRIDKLEINVDGIEKIMNKHLVNHNR